MISLVNQTLNNIEIICIDDGSTDNSKDILDKYKDLISRVKIFSQTNKGPAQARNLGINNSSAEFIMFCDSDDLYDHKMCESMLSTIQNKNVDLVICDCNLINESFIQRNDTDYYRLNLFGLSSLTNEIRVLVNVVLWNKIFKRSIIEEYKVIFPQSSMGEDQSFVHQYICAAKTIYGLDKILYNYRLHDSSLMEKFQKDSQNGKDFCFQNIDAYSYTFNSLKANSLLTENIDFFLIFFFFPISLVNKKK